MSTYYCSRCDQPVFLEQITCKICDLPIEDSFCYKLLFGKANSTGYTKKKSVIKIISNDYRTKPEHLKSADILLRGYYDRKYNIWDFNFPINFDLYITENGYLIASDLIECPDLIVYSFSHYDYFLETRTGTEHINFFCLHTSEAKLAIRSTYNPKEVNRLIYKHLGIQKNILKKEIREPSVVLSKPALLFLRIKNFIEEYWFLLFLLILFLCFHLVSTYY